MSQQQLPLYYKNHRPTGPVGKSQIRCKEFQLIVVLLLTFVLVWLGLVTYMPEIGEPSTQFDDAYKQFTGYPDSRRQLGTTDLTPLQEPNQDEKRKPLELVSDKQPGEDNGKPAVEFQTESTSKAPSDGLPEGIDKAPVDEGNEDDTRQKHQSRERPPVEHSKVDVGEKGGSPRTAHGSNESVVANVSVTEQRRAKVVEMIKHAWDGYATYALGENEWKPISKKGHSAMVFGKTKVGATIVDSLDTLYITGLKDEFQQARDWVSENLNLDEVNSEVSLFEFNIRFIGGLLSSFALTGDEMFVEKAVHIIEKLMPAFQTATGLPKSLINVRTGQIKNWGWASGGCSVLSEVGSLHLEFQYLTHLTGIDDYLNKVNHIRNHLYSLHKPDGLYPNYINPNSGNWGQRYVSLGALGDSFYEYLIKAWLGTSKEDTQAQEMFYDSLKPLETKTFQHTHNDLLVVSDFRNGRADGKMQHLTCFAGGMFALASQHATNGFASHYMDVAKEITRTCHESYQLTPTKLGPEVFRFDGNGNMKSRNNEKMYLLRPETVESYFYLWRLTHDPIYREWGWEVVQALEANCRVENGYSGLKDVYNASPPKDDVQQTFYIAETLKYLYLLFSDDSVLPLDRWVFNTEAHPLPVLPGIPRPVTNPPVTTDDDAGMTRTNHTAH